VFEWDETNRLGLTVRAFVRPDAEWLAFVAAHRRGQWEGEEYDIIRGPVADDVTMPVIQRYLSGVYDEAEALKRLLPQRLTDQFAFVTVRALATLVFVRGEEAE
jgi:hypothetical protein